MGAVLELITESPLPIPTWRQQIRKEDAEVFLRHKLISGRFLGWLKSHYKCTEWRRQMVRMLNSELTFILANAEPWVF